MLRKIGRESRLENLCAAGAVLCLLYYFMIVFYAGITADFAWIWIFFALLLFGVRQILCFSGSHPGVIPVWILRAGLLMMAAGAAVFLIQAAQVAGGMFKKAEPDLDYVIVLGAQVKGEKPSRALRKRLDCAYEYAVKNPRTKLILSGGQGSGEDISEAECMRRYLTEAGLEPDRLLAEDRSTSTRENLEFCRSLYHPENARTGILSNNFHICRALILARDSGYTRVSGIPAHSDPWMQPHYIVREVFALSIYRISQFIH